MSVIPRAKVIFTYFHQFPLKIQSQNVEGESHITKSPRFFSGHLHAMASTRLGLGLGLAAGAGWYLYRKQQAPTLVVGGGVMGLSTATALAASGRKVILVDAAHPIRGSWGITRASHFRMEDPELLQMGLYSSRYYKQLQEQYEAEARRSPDLKVEDSHFYHCTGSAMAGPKEQIENIAVCVKKELGDLPEAQHELLSASEVEQRFPQLKLDADECLIYMPIGFTMLPGFVVWRFSFPHRVGHLEHQAGVFSWDYDYVSECFTFFGW